MADIIELHMSKKAHPRKGFDDINKMQEREDRIMIAEVIFLMAVAMFLFVGFVAFLAIALTEVKLCL